MSHRLRRLMTAVLSMAALAAAPSAAVSVSAGRQLGVPTRSDGRHQRVRSVLPAGDAARHPDRVVRQGSRATPASVPVVEWPCDVIFLRVIPTPAPALE